MVIGARSRWPVRAVRFLMLVLGIVATPGAGLEALQRPHCAQHELGSRHDNHQAALTLVARVHAPAGWTQQHDHSCPHCPASECARVAPCAGSALTALKSSGAVTYSVQDHRVGLDLDDQHVHSAVSPPDTRPPQLIS